MEQNNSDLKCGEAFSLLDQMLENGNLTTEGLQSLVASYPDCEKELMAMAKTWNDLDELEVPDRQAGSDKRFEKMLSDVEKDALENVRRLPLSGINFLKYLHWAAILLIGIGIGFLISGRPGSQDLSDHATVEINPILASLESEESAISRLKTIQGLKKDGNPNQQIYEALYATLINDPNENVRLSALEALVEFDDKEKIRELVIKAVVFQDSPLVQLSLLEVLLAENDSETLNIIKDMLKDGRISGDVKYQVEEAIDEI